jgi:hypothetical protein
MLCVTDKRIHMAGCLIPRSRVFPHHHLKFIKRQGLRTRLIPQLHYNVQFEEPNLNANTVLNPRISLAE